MTSIYGCSDVGPSTALTIGPALHEGGAATNGLHRGQVTSPPEHRRSRRGRLRRWFYTAAGGTDKEHGDWLIGAAVVAAGPFSTAFAFGHVGDEHLSWDSRGWRTSRRDVGETPDVGAAYDGAVSLDWQQGLGIDTGTWSIGLSLDTVAADLPAICATATPAGGWNVTQKLAGVGAAVTLTTPRGRTLDDAQGVAWLDWTSGRQDSRTTWRWGAGGAVTDHGRRIGWNVSTGMNEIEGEDVVWLDGVPHRLEDVVLQPTADDTRGRWGLTAGGMDLVLEPSGVRAAREQLVIASSHYVQPYGVWAGTVVAPDATSLEVRGHGVAEDHRVRW